MQRRQFLKTAATAGGLLVLPARAWAVPPSGRIGTGHIGTGGKGGTDTRSITNDPRTEVLGLCDVDKARGGAEKYLQQHPNARFFQDYREMLATLGDKIDAVSVSTPDHTHYPASLAAMTLGKHVYTQKPLVRKVAEARHLMTVAREKKLATQMGIQNQSTVGYRMAVAYLRSGVIGKVRSVHVWSYKNWGYDGPPYKGEDPVPDSLDWNLWLATAPRRPYLRGKYHPSNWRRMLDFGTGTLGDMGVHIFDTPFRALKLTAPTWVEATCREPTGFGHPTHGVVRYSFPGTEYTTKVLEWTWYDGQGAPPKDHPDLAMPEGQRLPKQGGMFVGEKGRMLLEHIAGPRFLPRELSRAVERPKVRPVNHYRQWLDAILGTGEPTARFAYAAPLTETVLLGVVAHQFPGKKLAWDAEKMAFPDLPDANPLLKATYRKY
jgi:predicted dehydrogenase